MAAAQGRGNARSVLILLGLLVFLQGAMATDFVVGGSNVTWIIPGQDSLSNTYYDSWSKNQTFHVGDNLVFTYRSAGHNVYEVTDLNYKSCNATAIKKYTSGNDTIALSKTGTFYYLCGVPGHCSAGMKLAVTVVSSSGAPSPGPATSAATPGPSAVPPSSSGASGVQSAAGMFVAAAVLAGSALFW